MAVGVFGRLKRVAWNGPIVALGRITGRDALKKVSESWIFGRSPCLEAFPAGVLTEVMARHVAIEPVSRYDGWCGVPEHQL
jgi:hypothetical protein